MADDTSIEALQTHLERILLGGNRKYTRLQVAERAGVPQERTARLWRALGFATVSDDAVVFTDADVEAVRLADELVRDGMIDASVEAAVTRTLGQHLSRLAEWQVDILWSLIGRDDGTQLDEHDAAALVDRLLPNMERIQNYVWRRHLAAFAGRALAAPGEELDARTQTVGFVDMVGYTRLTRRLDESQLGSILEKFEEITTEVVAQHRGSVVKMIGDEVLFIADNPPNAAEIALALTERTTADKAVPTVRGGLAYGRVLSRFGDVYGSTVNLASRLASVARPGTVLVDTALARELGSEPAYKLRTRRPLSVRGYQRLRPSALRRAPAQRSAGSTAY